MFVVDGTLPDIHNFWCSTFINSRCGLSIDSEQVDHKSEVNAHCTALAFLGHMVCPWGISCVIRTLQGSHTTFEANNPVLTGQV